MKNKLFAGAIAVAAVVGMNAVAEEMQAQEMDATNAMMEAVSATDAIEPAAGASNTVPPKKTPPLKKPPVRNPMPPKVKLEPNQAGPGAVERP